jgi:hypothetical protein
MLIIPVRDSDRITAKIIIEANRYKKTLNSVSFANFKHRATNGNPIHKQDAKPAGLSKLPTIL